MDYKVDRSSLIPYYIQVKDSLLARIKRNEWEMGEQLPGEPQLCLMFDVSRTVIRQALQELERQGYVVRKKGKGTFVASPKISGSLVQRLTGFYENMTNQGKTTITHVLKQEQVPATPKVAHMLELEPGTLLVHIVRQRFVMDEPIVLVSSYYPFERFPSLLTLDLEGNKSLYRYLMDELGVKIARGLRTIEAVAANEYEAEHLNIAEGDPLILLDSVTYEVAGMPIEYYHALHRGDRSKFEVELICDR